MTDYHINIFYSEEDGGYVADIPDLQACSAFGESPAEALSELEQAKTVWLAAAKDAGRPVPRPRYRPATYEAMVEDYAVQLLGSITKAEPRLCSGVEIVEFWKAEGVIGSRLEILDSQAQSRRLRRAAGRRLRR